MIDEICEKFNKKADKVLEHYQNEINNIRAGRANKSILDKITIEYYGTETKINTLCNIAVPEARLITITPYDSTLIKQITKAINAADIGITPNDDGKVIRLVFPQLTEEKRLELIKQIKKITENMKVSLRNERREIIEEIKRKQKYGEFTKDDVQSFENKILKCLEKKVAILEKMFEEKEKEIMEI